MDNLSQNFENEHPPHEQFLLYVDGELSAKEAVKWQSHLDACWACRVRVGKIESTIADIIEFENTVSNFQVSRDGQGWGNFDSRLNALAQEIEKKSLTSRFFDLLKQGQNFLTFNWMGKFAASSLAVFLIFAILYQFVTPAPVSASELLEKAVIQQQENLKAANQPVVYQKLKISQAEKSAVVEVWSEIGTAKNKKSSTAGDAQEKAEVLGEYEAAMAQNGLSALKPLSSEVFRAWRVSLADKTDTVSQIKTTNGEDAFKLTTTVGEPLENGEIVQASLIVRQMDWHAVSQSIQIKAANQIKNFEVSEMEFQILNRDVLAKNFFNEDSELAKEIVPNVKISPVASPNNNPSPSPSAEKSPETIVKTESAPNAPTVAATADLEVEVLRLLNQAKADLGEQINVKRTGDGKLLVSGIVETEQRKTELLNALDSVANNPAVKFEILSVKEAVALQKPGKSPQSATQQSIESQGNSIAAENDLREYFAGRGGDTEANIRTFSASIVGNSRQATQHLWAMKKLIGQFTSAQESKLTPEARAKLLGLIRNHAATFREQSSVLRRQLKPVFFAGADDGSVKAGGTINNNEDLKRLINQLIETGTANDGIVRSAFTASGSGIKITVAKSPQFWQSLKTAEALAARLEAIK